MKKQKKRAKSAPRKPRNRPTMAKKKTARRRPAAKATATKRRSAPRKRFDIMSSLMAVGMAAAGYLVAEYGIPKLMPTGSVKTRAAIAAGAGLVLPMFMPSLAPLAIGMGAQGAVTIGRDLLKLPMPGAVPIGALSPEARNRIAAMAEQRRLNGYSGAQPINGYSGTQPINGTTDMTGDRAYV